jgi:hypothetical protein
MKPKGPAIRKRAQIATTKRLMFVWVAGVSVILGFAIVGSIFLTRMLLFNERVLAEKNKTIATLARNNEKVKDLESGIRALDTNQDLMDIKASPEDKAIQVILDALPSEANSLALGASIQNKLLNVSGVEIITLQVDPVAGVESLSSYGASQNTTIGSSAVTQNEITFRFSIQCNVDAMKKVLLNLEKSIRTIDIVTMKIEGQNTLTVQGRAFYEPERVVKLMEKTIK